MAVVTTRNLTKVFKEGELGAVNDVNLETHEGEFLVFLGPSGSGKTTLLRMIAGLETPTAGEILIGGKVVNDLTPRERRIAMVFQSYALYPHLTVYKNIAFPLKAQNVPRHLHKDKVEWAASLLGIGALLNRKPRELSGGERQRVALARAIVREPSVFLLDEPLSNLDAKLRLSAREELERFHRRVGTTTIYVTHDQVEAMAMGDRIMVLNKGVVRQIGTPKEVYDDPADTFVATFLGSPPMNLIQISGMIAGFRPEHFRLNDEVKESAKLGFKFRVENVEYLGAEFIVSGILVGGPANEKKVIARLLLSRSFEIGSTYDFAVAERDLKFFDATTDKKAQVRALSWQ
ncbi:MAG TPA: ATP-binding cassette domain-containing protein [Candidatus Angelobacter sp.]|nr:ATP-binding cassette domain-containing protein [Candidatus Angelobacter sp.]